MITVFSECIGFGNSQKASQLVFLPFHVFGHPKVCELHHFWLFCSASMSRRARFQPQLPQGQRTLLDFFFLGRQRRRAVRCRCCCSTRTCCSKAAGCHAGCISSEGAQIQQAAQQQQAAESKQEGCC